MIEDPQKKIQLAPKKMKILPKRGLEKLPRNRSIFLDLAYYW